MELNPKHAMVVLSGGQDSTTCLGWALDKYERVDCITFDYGQKHRIEIDAARDVRKFLEQKFDTVVPHTVVTLGPILLSSSPLTNAGVELETYTDHESMEGIIGDRVEKTFVPLRNPLFLTIAANHAIAAGCGVLVTGVCQADNANYPDCTQDFINLMSDAINEALGAPVGEDYLTIETPLMDLSKAESIALALTLPFTYDALAFSHTAYDGTYPPTSKDHASILRAHGFEQAGVPDPLVLRAHREGLMELPLTVNYVGVGR